MEEKRMEEKNRTEEKRTEEEKRIEVEKQMEKEERIEEEERMEMEKTKDPVQKLLSQQHSNINKSNMEKTTEMDENDNNNEKQTLEAELQKCIEDLKNFKIPPKFAKKQRHWQNELLKKYNM
eukprot:gi/632936165/ref/XP_007892703.1/ PREDICTED: BTB/POZ domain-containing protein KCTD16-like [Callorhinchus milii]